MQDFCLADIISTHILTKRMTELRGIQLAGRNHFNSHPHEEDDLTNAFDYETKDISTHILTKRMTVDNTPNNIVDFISTHILTKRMT